MKKQVAKLVAGLTVAAFAALSLPTTSGAAASLRIWADADRKASVEKVAGAWVVGQTRGWWQATN
ncbi:MAG: hypothetical protein EBX38_03875 [Actinobacteria bacterium]|nr:hypothetical protein [Actinomycetota bacterium]